eukprot:CAMPEP_0115039998 /NCGR_PEP_ID=MMETSP0216-20121206/44518_1 /TAXON_ID=223996 /ORGANISM="Protocruzia adherens, Strain Boccale" /LENGTH=145 /DNA_ID=CAMNT_0002421057 /DNA_START=107 /DNA_END=541 /DNA_ORIENTATION=-
MAHGFTCSPDGARLYVVGGCGRRDFSFECWSYDLSGGEWLQLADMPEKALDGSCFCLGDRDGYCVVYAYSGSVKDGVFVYNVSMADVGFEAGVWQRLQGCQWDRNRGIIFTSRGEARTLELTRGKFALKKLTLYKDWFWGRAGFC